MSKRKVPPPASSSLASSTSISSSSLIVNRKKSKTSTAANNEIHLNYEKVVADNLANAINTDLKLYKDSRLSSKIFVKTRAFPRHSMELLLNSFPVIFSFENVCDSTRKFVLTNPDLKYLLKHNGSNLQQLIIRLNNDGEGGDGLTPKFQGCGFRWLAKHATNLTLLEIPLQFDVKKQLVERLECFSTLKRLKLTLVGDNLDAQQLKTFLEKATKLTHCTILNWNIDKKQKQQLEENFSNIHFSF